MAQSNPPDQFVVQYNAPNSPMFTQQGTVDWTALGRATVNASVGVLARLSGAGVDPYTVVVGQALASQFRLSRLGNHRLETALANLPLTSGLGNALWFGFGIQNLIRSLAQTTEGVRFIMLASSLAAVHSTDFSARVISALVEQCTAGEAKRLTPSLAQWHSLAKTCSGVLATTSFSVVAEQMMTLGGHTIIASETTPGGRMGGDPNDIAQALRAIGSLSTGSSKSITLLGGAECGWVAAVAHWFFELDVEIRDELGNVLRPSARKGIGPQVLVIYAGADTNSLEVIGKSYAIRAFVPGMLSDDGAHLGLISGRVHWETALRDAFGLKTTRRLLEQTAVFGKALGSASRIFEGISLAEPDVPLEVEELEKWCAYGDQSYGRGYLAFATSRLPELELLRESAENAFNNPLEHAVGQYQVAMAQLAILCNCKVCSDDHRNPRSNFMTPTTGFCLPLLAEVIIRLSWLLSFLSFKEDLLPTRAGIETLYHSCISNFVNQRASDEYIPPRPTRSLAVGLDFTSCLIDAIVLFTGQSPGIVDLYPAVSFRGICFYIDALRALTDQPAIALRIHIIPGGIEAESGRSFDRIESSPIQNENPVITYPADQAISSRGLPLTKGNCSPAFDVQLVVEESIRSLIVYTHINVGNHWVLFGPAILTRRIITATGLIPCARHDCLTLPPLFPYATVSGEGHLRAEDAVKAGHELILRQVSGNAIARCIALLVDETGPNGENHLSDPTMDLDANSWDGNLECRWFPSRLLLQGSECLSCSVRAATRFLGSKGAVYIIQS